MLPRGRTLALCALSAALVRCGSCNEKALDGGATDAGAPSPTSQLSPEQASKVLARVGDTTITLGDYVAALEHMDQFDRLRYQSPERRKELLNEMIEVELLAREATAKGYDKDPLAQQEQRAILRDALLKDARRGLPGPADIPAEEIRAYFEAHKADYKDPERRRVSCIVVREEAVAKAILDQAKKATAVEFGQLVRDRSIDAQARANVPVDLAGDFGMVSPPGDARGDNPRIPEEVRTAAFEIGAVGGVYDKPVRSGDRVFVVRLTQKADAHERTFAEAERSVRVKLAQEKMRAKDEELVAQLRKDFPVQIDDAVLAQVQPPGAAAGDAGARD